MKKTISLFNLFLYTTIIVLIGEVILLSYQNKSLKEEMALRSLGYSIQVGDSLTVHEFLNVRSNEAIADFKTMNDKFKLLFLFNSECPGCTHNVDPWKTIYQQVKTTTSVIGISSDENPDKALNYAKQHELPYDIYMPAQYDFFEDNKISGVPLTLLIDSKGNIKGLWKGILNEINVRNIISECQKIKNNAI